MKAVLVENVVVPLSSSLSFHFSVSRKPFLTKGLAVEGVVAWLPFRLLWVKDPKGAWELPAALISIYLNI